ncbi:MAG: OmpH family outer membrane protein [Haliscomenobacter sp.]|nr:OmpH family outer membrane protein [Haliscomenobacter sp.]MBK7475176.1 OmpH family outer membrane protein [Haliscomenobacter sp.]MBK8879716.1 OmpH family outer membrane protein [Haliscomenobacter sp.]
MKKSGLATALKRTFFSFSMVFLFSLAAQAQRIAFVDVNKVLESVPEYTTAQGELDALAARWRQEIAQEYDKIKGLYNRYQAEQVLLSDEARRQREEEIMAMEKDVRDMQRTKFGPDGSLFQRRQELVRPIQDKIYATIERYAQERGFDFIFDRSSSAGIIFSNPIYDKTEDIIRMLK